MDSATTSAEKRLNKLAAVITRCRSCHETDLKECVVRFIACDEAIEDASIELDLLCIKYKNIETEMIKGKLPLTHQQWEDYKLLEELTDYAAMIIITGKQLLKKYKTLIMKVVGYAEREKLRDL